MTELSAWLAPIAALLSAIATGFAGYAAWKAPRSAAELAEKLRKQSELETETRRMKVYIFTQLMQDRGTTITREGTRALNLIDLVYADSDSVRDAWAELYNSYGIQEMPWHERQKRLHNLLKVMATDLGLSGRLRVDDFGRIYYPIAIEKEDRIQMLRNERLLKELEQVEAKKHDEDGGSEGLWPPRPA